MNNTIIASQSLKCKEDVQAKSEEMVVSNKVLDLSLEELEQARRLINSEMMHYLCNMNYLLRNGYKLSKAEQTVLDTFFEEYQLTYKSPLAKVMQED